MRPRARARARAREPLSAPGGAAGGQWSMETGGGRRSTPGSSAGGARGPPRVPTRGASLRGCAGPAGRRSELAQKDPVWGPRSIARALAPTPAAAGPWADRARAKVGWRRTHAQAACGPRPLASNPGGRVPGRTRPDPGVVQTGVVALRRPVTPPSSLADDPGSVAAVVGLAVATGTSDVTAFMRLGHVFTSVMTGNIVLLGLSAGSRSASLAIHTGTAIAAYVAGALVATAIVSAARARTRARIWPPGVVPALGAELVVLVAISIAWEVTRGGPGGWARLTLLGLLALAMGVQSGAVNQLGVPGLSTTYLTGTLTRVAAGVFDPHRRTTASRDLTVLLALGGGAGLGALCIAVAPAAIPALWLGPLLAAIGRAVAVNARPSTPAAGPAGGGGLG